MIMNATQAAKFETALRAAAAKAGIALEGLKWEQCTTDRTWGDRCGLVFHGASAQVNRRAAEFFHAWVAAQPRRSSYEAQSSLSVEGLMHFTRWSNGACGWSKGALQAAPAPAELAGCSGFVLARTEAFEGYAVNTTYYPCAD